MSRRLAIFIISLFHLTNIFASRLVGVVNSVLLIPVTISFATIIYRDAFFEPNLPTLIKLVVFSSLVHQIVFTARSSLPYAVGQVIVTSEID